MLFAVQVCYSGLLSRISRADYSRLGRFAGRCRAFANNLSLFNKSDFSDFQVISKNQAYPVHKCIIACRGGYFRIVITSDYKVIDRPSPRPTRRTLSHGDSDKLTRCRKQRLVKST